MTTAFLSYSRDDRAFARRLVAALEARGISVWWDELLEGGERFSAAIEQALNDADVVIVLWSKVSVHSHWVQDEAERGRERGRLVPASIDGTPPPLGFGQFQALDLARWKGKVEAEEMSGLLRSIELAAGREAVAPPKPIAGSGPNRRHLLIGGGVALATAGTGFGLWQSGWLGGGGNIENSVAVLPFRNLSGDPGQDYFAEGLAEEVRAALARNPLLKVTATTSSAKFKDRDITVPEIASQLGVAHLLEGNVRRFEAKVRIGVQLISGVDAVTLWSRTFEENYTDLFEMQSGIARTVSDVLTAQATGRGARQAGEDFSINGGTANTEAFDSYLRAFAAYDRGRVSDNFLEEYSTALSLFDRAIALDPNYAAAYSGRSRYYTRMGQIKNDRNLLKLGFEDAEKCIKLAPRFADGYTVMGFSWLFYKMNASSAYKFYQKVRELGWGDVKALMGYEGFCAGFWRIREAEQAIQRMLALDPLSVPVQLRLVSLRVVQNRNSEALEIIDRLLSEGMRSDDLTYWASRAHMGKRNYAMARLNAEEIKDEFQEALTLAEIDLAAGADVEFERRANEIFEKFGNSAEHEHVVTIVRCIYLAHKNEIKSSIDLLEQQYKNHNTLILSIRDQDIIEERLGGHPRYIALCRAMGLTGKPPKFS